VLTVTFSWSWGPLCPRTPSTLTSFPLSVRHMDPPRFTHAEDSNCNFVWCRLLSHSDMLGKMYQSQFHRSSSAIKNDSAVSIYRLRHGDLEAGKLGWLIQLTLNLPTTTIVAGNWNLIRQPKG
jgi:hypothetical protein